MLSLLLLLTGCPDPTAVADGPATELPPSPMNPGEAPLPPGDAPPDQPAAPGAPGAPTDGGGGRPDVTGFAVSEADGVVLSGTVTYSGAQAGTLRIDVLRNSPGATFPELIHTAQMPSPGPWRIVAPKSLGDISIVAYLDSGNNGPNAGEPAGMIEKVTVGTDAQASLDIALSDEPNLGGLKPTADAAAPDGTVTPPPSGVSGPEPITAPKDAVGTPQ